LYKLRTDWQSDQQIAALPAEALAPFAELRTFLEVSPWAGDPIHRRNPDGPVRAQPFGDSGLVTYLILEGQRLVDIVEVLWAG
jgi:hypothetical protein